MQVKKKYPGRYEEMKETQLHLEETWHRNKTKKKVGKEHEMHSTSTPLAHTFLICTTKTRTRSVCTVLAYIPSLP